MTDNLEKLYGRVVFMGRDTDGSTLTAAASIADTVLHVASTADFDVEDGGQVVVGGEIYEYTDVDEDASTITLDTGLLAAADEDDPVELYDSEVGGIVVEYVAQVLLDDQDPGDRPIEVTVHHGLVNYLAEKVRGGAAESVVLIRDGDDDFVIWQIDGKLAVDIVIEALTGGYVGTLQDIFDAADAAALAAADAAANATIAQTTADGKNTVYYSLSAPGSTPNTAGDIWFQKDSSTQTVIHQFSGQGGTSWVEIQLTDAVIANLDAGKLTAGSAFINSLIVKTNFQLGDAATNGVIQSYDFAGSSVGVYIDKFGIVAKGGSLSGTTIVGATLQTAGSGQRVVIDSSNRVTFYDSSGSVGYIHGSGGAIQLVASNVLASGDVAVTGTLNAADINMSGGGTMNVAGDISATGDITATGEITAGQSFFDSTLVGGGGTGANINNNGKIIRTPPSARRFKTDIETLAVDPAALVGIDGVTFRYLNAEEFGDDLQVGLIAEDLADAGLGVFVTRNEAGETTGIRYDRLVVALLPVLRDLTARVEALEAAS